MLRSVVVVALLASACSRPPAPSVVTPPDRAATPAPTPTPSPAPAPQGSVSAVQRVCGTPLEQALRARLPALVPCGRREVVTVHVDVNGHALDVVGHGTDPCCTDTGPPEMLEGSMVFLDGAPYSPASHGGRDVTTALGPLADLTDEAARPLLQAMLVMRTVLSQTLTTDEQRALFERWPASRIAVTRAPPGLTTSPRGRTLRVWNERSFSERGVSCRLLERHEVTLTRDGRLAFEEPIVFGEGRRMGQPCADALPAAP